MSNQHWRGCIRFWSIELLWRFQWRSHMNLTSCMLCSEPQYIWSLLSVLLTFFELLLKIRIAYQYLFILGERHKIIFYPFASNFRLLYTVISNTQNNSYYDSSLYTISKLNCKYSDKHTSFDTPRQPAPHASNLVKKYQSNNYVQQQWLSYDYYFVANSYDRWLYFKPIPSCLANKISDVTDDFSTLGPRGARI